MIKNGMQKTLKKDVIFKGVGVHLGLPSEVILRPAPVNSGIVFVNPNFPEEKIVIGKNVPESAMHASVIKANKWFISTVEHLMSVISCLQLDNLAIEVNGPEIPILDGSALGFLHGIQEVGLESQDAQKYFLTPKEKLVFEDKDGRLIEIIPAQKDTSSGSFDTSLHFSYFADFDHPLLGKSELHATLSKEYFLTEIAPARTFGFLEQLPYLRRHGLAQGTTLGNTVVIGEEEFLNDTRFENEFIRHKVLDLIGDLALLGKNLAGTIKAKKTGHSFNRLVVEHYIKKPEMWQLI